MKLKVCLLSILLLVVALSAGTTAYSAMTGNDFLQVSQSYQNGFVSGFVRGMYITCLDQLDTKKQVCSLESVLDVTFEMTAEQVLDIFLKYLKRNADFKQRNVSDLFIDCLREIAKTPHNPNNPGDKK